MTTRRSFRSGLLKAALFSATLLTIFAVSAQAQINTIPSWDGSNFISSFGVTNTATYGQTITVAAGASQLNSFSFEIGYCSASVALRGSVYAWDGTKATGSSLFTSAVRTVTAGDTYTLVTFNTGGITLPAGTYVLFGSTSQDQADAPGSACRWGSVGNNTAYAGGQFVYINNGPNPGQWTTATWSSISQDLAFQVNGLVVPAASVPAASTTSLLIAFAGLIAVGLYLMARSRLRTS
jgi:hypothetical protein